METALSFLIRQAKEKGLLFSFTITRDSGRTKYFLFPDEFEKWYKQPEIRVTNWSECLDWTHLVDAIEAAESIQGEKERAIKDTNSQIAILEHQKAEILKPFEDRLAEIERYCTTRKESEK